MLSIMKKGILKDLERRLYGAFSKVNTDISHMQKWIDHLYDKQTHIERSHASQVTLTKKDISTVNQWLNYLHSHNDDVNRHLHALTSYIHEQSVGTKALLQRIERLEEEHKQVGVVLQDLKKRGEEPSQVQVRGSVRTEPEVRFGTEPKYSGSRSFERDVMTKIRQNKKVFVFNKMLDALKSGQLTTKELEKIIVEEKGFCGRTTFYAYLKELRNTGQVGDSGNEARSVLVPKVV
ncbi:MAG: hypothetical protein ABIC95_01060 [archaeon]